MYDVAMTRLDESMSLDADPSMPCVDATLELLSDPDATRDLAE